ncbi:hypothetical protein ACLB2K_043465 [Fragaria x ananassa]
MEPTLELKNSKEEFLNNYFCISKKAILEDSLFPLSLTLLSAAAPDLIISEYTKEELMLHCSRETIGYCIKQFQTLIPGWLKIEKGIVKIDRSRGKYHRNKLLDERYEKNTYNAYSIAIDPIIYLPYSSLSSHFGRRGDPKTKDKMQSLYNYIDSSKDMLPSMLLHNILFKSGTFDDNILKADFEDKRVTFITGSKGKTQDLLLGSKTIHQLVKLRQFFVRKEQEHKCNLCEHKLFPMIAPYSDDILSLERLTMLPCSHQFHEDCIVHRLNIDINLQAHHNEQLANNVRAQMGEATRRGLEMERALTDLSKLDKGDRYQVLAKLRRCERDRENIKQEVERFGKQLQALDEPIMPKCPICLMIVSSFP